MSATTDGPARDVGTYRLLLIEDNLLDARLVREWLRDGDPGQFTLQHVDRLSAGLAALTSTDVDLVLLDLALPDSAGLDTFRHVHAAAPEVPVVVLSGLHDEHLALEAMHAGAQDYVLKGAVDGPTLGRVVRYALERQQWLARAEAARAEAVAARAEAEAARAEAEAARSWAEVLARVSEALAQSLEYETTLRQVGELVVQSLASYCTIDLLTDGGRLERLVATGANPADASRLHLLATYPPQPGSAHPVWQVLDTGQPFVEPAASDTLLATIAQDAEHLALLRGLRVVALLILPLQAHGRTLGALQLLWRDDALRAGDGDAGPTEVLSVARALAGRAALAIDNARLYAELQAAVDSRDTLLAAVAHDLRTPLTTIKLLAQLVRLRQSGRLPADAPGADRVPDPLTQLDALTAHMEGTIQELVDAAQLRTGRALIFTRQPLDLVALVRTAVSHHRVHDHALQLEAPDTPLRVAGDGVRLLRVVDNLLSNAFKYSPNGAAVCVTVSSEGADGDGWAVVAVQDQGMGIPAADLPRAFEPYHRASNARGRVAGTGLGLWGVKQVVEEHGGTIALDSTEGSGTTATVRLPRT